MILAAVGAPRPLTFTSPATAATLASAASAPAGDQVRISGEKPATDWKSVARSAAIGAAMYGTPAALAAIHPTLGIAGAIGLAGYACWRLKSPQGLLAGAFIGLPSANVGNHWGFAGAGAMAGLGALSLGLQDYLAQRR